VALLVLLNAAVEAAEPYVHHDAVTLTYRVRTYAGGRGEHWWRGVYGKRTTLAALARNGFARTATTGRRLATAVDAESANSTHFAMSSTSSTSTACCGRSRRVPVQSERARAAAAHCTITASSFLPLVKSVSLRRICIALRRRLGELNAMDAHLDVYRWRVADDQAAPAAARSTILRKADVCPEGVHHESRSRH
jgi:hypothetical protein